MSADSSYKSYIALFEVQAVIILHLFQTGIFWLAIDLSTYAAYRQRLLFSIAAFSNAVLSHCFLP